MGEPIEQPEGCKAQTTSILNDKWILYAHLPHDTDWTVKS